MTCIDGFAMARKGRAAALAVAAINSFLAGTVHTKSSRTLFRALFSVHERQRPFHART